MEKGKIEVFGTFIAKDGHQEDLKAVLAEMAGEAKHDPGCLRFDLLQNPEDDKQFMFSELWESETALAEHLKMPYLPRYRERRTPFLAGGPEISKWTMIV
jgi:quinol monooxygenase YgiN